MSLDVSLTGKTSDVPCDCARCGNSHTRKETEEFFSANITHNLTKMADIAGLYKPVWHPSENGITKASQLIEPLRAGIAIMKSDRDRFEDQNADNGWGTYEQFVPWLEKYLAACEENPDADVSARG